MAGRSRVWLVEDNDFFRSTIQGLIDAQRDLACPVATATCEDALAELDSRDESPDILLMDIGLPGMSGIQGARDFLERVPDLRVIMLTVHEEREVVFDAIVAGATGYLLKSSPAEQIVESIRDVVRGAAPINPYIARKVLEAFSGRAGATRYGLTERECEILRLLTDGLTMQRVADELAVSYHTIDSHVRNIYDKLQVHSRGGAIAKALRERLI